MSRTRFRRKDLKQPDEFVSAGRRALLWAGEHRQRLYQALGALAVVLVFIGGFYSLQGARARQANEELGVALGALREGKYAEAARQFGEVASQWASTGPGLVAHLYAAGAQLQAGNPGAVPALVEPVLKKGGLPSYLRQQALVTLAFALEQQGDLAKAATRYREAAAEDGPFTGEALLGEARCREKLGEAATARELYQRYVREFPGAPDVARISARAEALAS